MLRRLPQQRRNDDGYKIIMAESLHNFLKP